MATNGAPIKKTLLPFEICPVQVSINEAIILPFPDRPEDIYRVEALVLGYPYVYAGSYEGYKIYTEFAVVGKFKRTWFGWKFIPYEDKPCNPT